MNRRWQPILPGIAAVVGAVASVGYVLALCDIRAVAESSPKILAWLTLVAAQGALAGLVLVSALDVLRQVRPLAPRGAALTALIFTACVGVLLGGELIAVPSLFGRHWQSPLDPSHTAIMAGLSAAYGAVALLAAFAMWMAALACPARPDVGALEVARTRLRTMLWMMGMQVAAATVATGGLRAVVLDGGWGTAKDFPGELVLAYGGFLAIVLAICFVPAYRHVQRAGEEAMARLVAEAPAGQGSEATIAKARELRSQLGLDTDAFTIFRDAVAISSPLLGAALSLVPR